VHIVHTQYSLNSRHHSWNHTRFLTVLQVTYKVVFPLLSKPPLSMKWNLCPVPDLPVSSYLYYLWIYLLVSDLYALSLATACVSKQLLSTIHTAIHAFLQETAVYVKQTWLTTLSLPFQPIRLQWTSRYFLWNSRCIWLWIHATTFQAISPPLCIYLSISNHSCQISILILLVNLINIKMYLKQFQSYVHIVCQSLCLKNYREFSLSYTNLNIDHDNIYKYLLV
jgi:hypothetical protein